MSDELYVLATYFNPSHYRRKRHNLELFLDGLRGAGVRCLIAEGAFAGEPFTLAPGEGVVQIRCGAILWQKERLLNLLLAQLPASCSKVAWLDADVRFADAGWAHKTARLLDEVPVVQPFARAIRLPPDQVTFAGEGQGQGQGRGTIHESFACAVARRPGVFLAGRFAEHGHTGFAWAARREILERHGFYDRAVAGGGDHLMAHALVGDWSSPCVQRMVGASGPEAETFAAWASELYDSTRAQLGFVPGDLLHFYHGDVERRRYSERHHDLARLGFDPRRDLRLDASGTWSWADGRADLARWGRDYFAARREDDAPTGNGY